MSRILWRRAVSTVRRTGRWVHSLLVDIWEGLQAGWDAIMWR